MKIVPLAGAMLVAAVLPAAAQDPVKAASSQYTLIAENEHVRVLRAILPPGVTTAMHAHPAHVGVTLSGGIVRMGLPDGKTADVETKADEVMPVQAAGSHTSTNTGKTTSTWKRGDVRLIGRGVPHETKGGKAPSEMIIVAVK
jgi:quercetin dioxygenase-like cupin family protein